MLHRNGTNLNPCLRGRNHHLPERLVRLSHGGTRIEIRGRCAGRYCADGDKRSCRRPSSIPPRYCEGPATNGIATLRVAVHTPGEAIAVEAARLRQVYPISLPGAYCLATAARFGSIPHLPSVPDDTYNA